MGILFLVFLILITITSLIFSIMGFAGKGVILDDTYIKASEEEREKMDKKAYRLQGAIVLLFLFVITLFNLLRALLHIEWLTYVAAGIGIIGIIYAIVSHYKIKKKSK